MGNYLLVISDLTNLLMVAIWDIFGYGYTKKVEISGNLRHFLFVKGKKSENLGNHFEDFRHFPEYSGF